MTFRQKTIFGVAVIEAILLVVLIWTGINYLRSINESELIKRAAATLTLLSRASRDAVLSTDIATLHDIVSDAISTPELGYVRILDPDGVILAEAGPNLPAHGIFSADRDYASVDDGSFDTAIDIKESNTRYGRLEIGILTSHIDNVISDAGSQATTIALVMMALVALFSLVLGTYLTRQLTSLNDASRRIINGELGYQLPVQGNDELAHTVRAFNKMSLHLQEDVKQQDAIIKSALDCIINMDNEGLITEFNPVAEETFGYSRNEVIGRPLVDTIIPPASREAHNKGLEHYLVTGETSILGNRIEVKAMRSDSTEFPVEMSINVTWIEKKPLFTAYLRDITERRIQEAAMRQAKNLAEEAAEAKSSFLANMSHEIRTPMNAVLGLLGLLANEDNLTAQQKAWVKTAHQSSGLLLNLINNTLDFSKIDSGKVELDLASFNLRSLIDTTINMFRPKAESRGITLSSCQEKTLPAFIEGDSGRLRQILINLVGNAIKFTHEGTINLDITLTEDSEQRFIRFAVSDTGVGIPAGDLDKLFTEFTQLTPGGITHIEGTGLGLAISRQLVTLMDGQIGVESEPDKGSCFWFEIPLVEGKHCNEKTPGTGPSMERIAPVTGNKYTQASRPAGHGARILLAEDSPANQMVALSMLKDTGYHIDTVINGKEAVESMRNLPYDLVLMDISMPEMNGMEATAVIRKLAGDKSHVPVIAMTAHAIKGDREKFLASGMDDYISKPVDKQLLLDILDKWLPEDPAATRVGNTGGPAIRDLQMFDINTLEQLARDTSPDLMPHMLAAFRKETIKRIHVISQSLSPLAAEQLEHESHSLKSSAGTFGAFDLQQLANELELACRNGRLEDTEIAARKIPDVWNQVIAELDHYLAITQQQEPLHADTET